MNNHTIMKKIKKLLSLSFTLLLLLQVVTVPDNSNSTTPSDDTSITIYSDGEKYGNTRN